jgi:hypothetical protein
LPVPGQRRCCETDLPQFLGLSDSGTPPYSHSIINELSKLLIRNAPDAGPQKFAVSFTVKVRSTSIGAGFRPVRPKLTFRDLSTSIDSHDHRGHHRRASVPVRAVPKKGWHRTP